MSVNITLRAGVLMEIGFWRVSSTMMRSRRSNAVPQAAVRWLTWLKNSRNGDAKLAVARDYTATLNLIAP